MADSFRNESIGCPYEWATESIDSDQMASIATIFVSEIEKKQ